MKVHVELVITDFVDLSDYYMLSDILIVMINVKEELKQIKNGPY